MPARRIRDIVGSGIFTKENLRHPLMNSAVTELLICLHDLLQACKRKGVRITFDEDVAEEDDITDLVSKMRNSACHINSGNRDHETDAGSVTNAFAVSMGAGGMAILGIQIGGQYKDDVTISYGIYWLYLNRHISRAYNEAVKELGM